MRISDWSSDVCSSDLLVLVVSAPGCLPPTVHLGQVLRERRAGLLDPALLLLERHGVPEALSGEQDVRAARLLGHREFRPHVARARSEEHTSELQSLMRISYAVFCLKKKKQHLKAR